MPPDTAPGSNRGGGAHWFTRGQPGALPAVARMVGANEAPHALMLVGPASIGKTTLAEDLAAGLLCTAPDPSDRPCRACRACRMVASGNHPDVHRLVPEGPAGQIVIGDPDDPRKPRGVRDLLRELVFLPMEGGARLAIVEGASQLNEDAQHALLTTLEEPTAGIVIVLCADDEALLLPTVRSRCARLRLGRTGPREIEAILAERGLADATVASRLARIAEGRPGVAVAYARAPESIQIRAEIARTLLDLLDVGRAGRLRAIREVVPRAGELAETLAGPVPVAPTPVGGRRPTAGRRTAAASTGLATEPGTGAATEPGTDPGAQADTTADAADGASTLGETRRTAPAERRRATRQLLEIWRDVGRDLAVIGVGGRAMLRDPGLLEELLGAAERLPTGAVAQFLLRLDLVADLVAGNVSPELALDVLVLAWPSSARPTV